MMGVVFCRTKRDTQNVAEELEKSGFRVAALHGDLSQQQRDRVMKRFKAHSLQALIATDVAARGIDVDSLTHVFHFSLPDTTEYYTHRSGRTARAGKKGISLAFITRGDTRKLKDIEKSIKATFTKVMIPNLEDVQNQKVTQWTEKIADVKVLPEVNNADLSHCRQILDTMSKDELIDKLLSYQLSKVDRKSTANLNISESSKDDTSDDRSRDMDWFNINLGKADSVGMKEIIEFIADVSQLTSKSIGDVIIKKDHSFFQIDNKVSEKLPVLFEGILIEDREVLVKKENPHPKDVEAKQKGKRSKSRFGGGAPRSSAGGRGGDRRSRNTQSSGSGRRSGRR